jgi:predicted transcriptional regulator
VTSSDDATLAWAEALDSWAATAVTLAERLRSTITTDPVAADQTSKLGRRQRELLNLDALKNPGGTSPEEVAEALGVALPNAHRLLRGLAARELVEQVPDTKPSRWRKADPESVAHDDAAVASRA